MALIEKQTAASNTGSAPTLSKTSASAFDWIAVALVVIGGLNWGLVGLFNFDLVAFLFGAMTDIARLTYVVVAIAALYAIFSFSKLSAAHR